MDGNLVRVAFAEVVAHGEIARGHQDNSHRTRRSSSPRWRHMPQRGPRRATQLSPQPRRLAPTVAQLLPSRLMADSFLRPVLPRWRRSRARLPTRPLSVAPKDTVGRRWRKLKGRAEADRGLTGESEGGLTGVRQGLTGSRRGPTKADRESKGPIPGSTRDHDLRLGAGQVSHQAPSSCLQPFNQAVRKGMMMPQLTALDGGSVEVNDDATYAGDMEEARRPWRPYEPSGNRSPTYSGPIRSRGGSKPSIRCSRQARGTTGRRTTSPSSATSSSTRSWDTSRVCRILRARSFSRRWAAPRVECPTTQRPIRGGAPHTS